MAHASGVGEYFVCGREVDSGQFYSRGAMAAIANLAEQEDNRQSMWLNRNCREAILAAVEVVATAASNVDTTPPIEKAGLRALELLTGVDMCR